MENRAIGQYPTGELPLFAPDLTRSSSAWTIRQAARANFRLIVYFVGGTTIAGNADGELQIKGRIEVMKTLLSILALWALLMTPAFGQNTRTIILKHPGLPRTGVTDKRAHVIFSLTQDLGSGNPENNVPIMMMNLSVRGFCGLGGGPGNPKEEFLALYVTTPTSGRDRLFNFNTACFGGFSYQGLTLLRPSLESEIYLTDPVTVEIVKEFDDGVDSFDTLLIGFD